MLPIYVRVCEDEDSDPIEVPTESDGTILLPTLGAQFPKCTGLKYKAPESGCFRGLRVVGDNVYPPCEDGWGDHIFFCVFPKDNKRKGDTDTEDTKQKVKCLEGRKCTDLIVLNLAWQTDEEKLRTYFSQFGHLVMVQIKRDPQTDKSRGYGFIRFSEYSGQAMCLAERHMIDGRLCDVRIPLSKTEGDRQEVGRRIHVGNLSENISADAVRQHFLQFGRVNDVFIPKPFRNFAFVTFEDSDVATTLIGKDMTIEGCRVSIGSAVPKLPSNQRQSNKIDGMPSGRAPYNALANGPFWGSSGAWSPFGMFSNAVQHGSMSSHGGSGPGMMRNGSSSGPMGLNPVVAEAAAVLTAQYTRAHQRQNASGPQSAHKTGMGSSGGSGVGGGSADDPTNTAALATLNILQNPNVLAAIVNAAAGVTGNVNFNHSHRKSDQS